MAKVEAMERTYIAVRVDNLDNSLRREESAMTRNEHCH